MTLIGVLSDTHVATLEQGVKLAERLLAGPFKEAELILHAGDIGCRDWLHLFAPVPLLAVRGNCDPAAADLPHRRQLTVAGVRLGLVHGWGAAAGLEERVLTCFDPGTVDVILYGHSHLPSCRQLDGVLCLNPGSASRDRSGAGATVARLLLEEGGTRGEILSLP